MIEDIILGYYAKSMHNIYIYIYIYIPILKIKRSHDDLILIMGIPVPMRRSFAGFIIPFVWYKGLGPPVMSILFVDPVWSSFFK